MNAPGKSAPALDCTAVVRALWDYLDGRVEADRRALIEEHLRQCESCRSHAEFEARLVKELSGLRHAGLDPAGLRERVYAVLYEAGMGER